MQVPILPIDLTSVVAVVMGMLIILVPVAGLTLRFALKPIAEAMARIKEAQGAGREVAVMQQRIDLLERQLSGVESEMARLREIQEFHSQLEAPKE
jgi:hypothetical protein